MTSINKETSIKKSKETYGFEDVKNSYLKKKSWYVFYLYPKSEKVVLCDLLKRKYEVYLPIIKKERVWQNRQKKKIEIPLFPGYIFVYTYKSELYNIKCCSNVVTYLHCCGKPSIVLPKDIECIKKMLQFNREIQIDVNLEVGERVEIVEGPLTGCEGLLLRRNGKTRFGIQLEGVNNIVHISIPSNFLRRSIDTL